MALELNTRKEVPVVFIFVPAFSQQLSRRRAKVQSKFLHSYLGPKDCKQGIQNCCPKIASKKCRQRTHLSRILSRAQFPPQDHTDVSFVFVPAKPATSAKHQWVVRPPSSPSRSLHLCFPTLDLHNFSMNLSCKRQDRNSQAKSEIKQELNGEEPI